MTEQQILPEFIVIDDDKTNNLICRKIISIALKTANIATFTDPELALAHILSAYSATDAENAIVFLDINMPVLNGWDVLNKLQGYPISVTNKLTIYMLSSSLAQDDIQKAKSCPLVSDYITKPISKLMLADVLQKYYTSKKELA